MQSDAVKKWRFKTKERIIISMGGKCCICGYNKSQSAMDLHHLDPATKSFNLGAIRGNPKSWNTIVGELRKCILICKNCHYEYHEGITNIPADAPKFDENYANYKEYRPDLVGKGNKRI